MHKCKCTLGESYTSILCSDAAGFSGPELISDSQKHSENVSCTQMSPHFNLFPGKMYFEFSVPKTKGTIQTFISDRSKSKRMSWYGGAAEQTAWVTGICAKVLLTWRHILGLYRDIYCHQDDVFEDHASSHSACATTAWFRRDRVNVLDRPADLSHIENV